MRLALERAGLEPSDVAAIWANRCGLKIADDAEAAAIDRVFGQEPPPVLAPRLQLGEPMGAGAPMNVALALTGWRHGDAEGSPVGPILINSASLGGTNFAIVLGPAPA
jgi:3-oxoacyl-(acyl-carrier-protein) synthase